MKDYLMPVTKHIAVFLFITLSTLGLSLETSYAFDPASEYNQIENFADEVPTEQAPAEILSDDAYGDSSDVTGNAGYDDHADKTKSDGLPQLDFSTYPRQIFWLIVIFGLMYTVVSRKALPDISSTIENRKNHIDADLSSAEKLQEEAEHAQSKYEQSLQEARNSAHETTLQADQSAKAKIADELKAFQKRAESDIAALETRIEASMANIMSNMNDIAADVATQAVEKIIGTQPDALKTKAIVESLNHSAKAKAA